MGWRLRTPACEPGQDTFMTAVPRLGHLAPGRPPLLAVRWPGATGLTSYLSGCISLTSQRCRLRHRRRFGRWTGLPGPFPSRSERSLCPAFQRLSFGGFVLIKPPESPAPCWRTVATVYPLGNCDSLRIETSLSYFTRFGAVSHRSSPHSSVFRVADGARTPPEELVNAASATRPCDRT